MDDDPGSIRFSGLGPGSCGTRTLSLPSETERVFVGVSDRDPAPYTGTEDEVEKSFSMTTSLYFSRRTGSGALGTVPTSIRPTGPRTRAVVGGCEVGQETLRAEVTVEDTLRSDPYDPWCTGSYERGATKRFEKE